MDNNNDDSQIDYQTVFELYLSDYKLWYTESTGEALPDAVIMKLAAEAWMSSPVETQIQNFQALTEVVKQELREKKENMAKMEKLHISEWHIQLSEKLPRSVARFLKSPKVVFSKRKYYLPNYPEGSFPSNKTQSRLNYTLPLRTKSAGTTGRMVPAKTGAPTNQLDGNKEAESKESGDHGKLLDVKDSEKEKELNHSQKKQPMSEGHRSSGLQRSRCLERFLKRKRVQGAYRMRKNTVPSDPPSVVPVPSQQHSEEQQKDLTPPTANFPEQALTQPNPNPNFQ